MSQVTCSCGMQYDDPNEVGYCVGCKKDICNGCAEPNQWLNAIEGICEECFQDGEGDDDE